MDINVLGSVCEQKKCLLLMKKANAMADHSVHPYVIFAAFREVRKSDDTRM